MFSRASTTRVPLTERSQHLIAAARSEAARLGNHFVSPEHLLLALLAEPSGEPCRVLLIQGLNPSQVRAELEEHLIKLRGPTAPGGELPFTSRVKAVLEAAPRESRNAGPSADPPSLLLGILTEAGSFAAQLLSRLGASAVVTRGLLQSDLGELNEFRVEIDDRSSAVVYEQIVNQIREAVATSRLRPGTRLPPVRQLADDLGIAPGTVSRAYSELEASKVTVTLGSRGTFIAVPGRRSVSEEDVPIRDLLRPIVVAAFHLGVSATAVREALEEAMRDIY